MACTTRAVFLACFTSGAARAADAVHLSPLSLSSSGATPWDFNPLWFVLLTIALPALLWVALAFMRVLDEDSQRLRRRSFRDLRRLLARLRRGSGTLRSADVHAWLQAVARTWDVRVSTPIESEFDASLRVLEGDAATRARWLSLWRTAERHLYAADATLPAGWIQESTAAAELVRIPPREHWFPGRVRHWMPRLAAAAFACLFVLLSLDELRAGEASSDLQGSGHFAEALRHVQAPANEALRADWNNWSAHYDIAAQQMANGNVDYAVAHLTAAFLQRPASGDVQDNLRWSLQQAGSMDPTLRRLLYGAWFQRYPALLAPATWQRLALLAAVLSGVGLGVLVVRNYATPRHRRVLRLTGRWAFALGIALLACCVASWNAWGDLHRPNAALLVEGINLSPAPTDLVKDRETVPMTAGSLTLVRGTFLGWRKVESAGLPGGAVSGWIRSRYVMPLYAMN